MELPRRVLLVGLDALDHRWLRSWMDAGRVPNIARFADGLLSLGVVSEGALLHGSVWPTFASGMSAGDHGLYWWTQWIAEEAAYSRSAHSALHYDAFWRAAALQGKRSIIVDVPYVPAVPEHTWTALGWGLHDEVAPTSYPAGFLPAIRKRYGDHPLRMDTMHSMDPREKLKMARKMRNGVALRAHFVTDIVARRDWDLFIVTFSEFHKVGHYLAAVEQLTPSQTNEDALLSVLDPLENALAGILHAAGPETDVALFALHGIEPQVEYSRVAGQLAAMADGRDLRRSVPRADIVRRLRDLLPPPLQQAIWYLLPPDVRQRRYTATVAQGLEGDERLFHVAHDGAIALRLNLAGREANGTVAPDEVDALLARANAVAQTFVTEDGAPAFESLVRTSERYPGPRSHRLPDALIPLNPHVFSAAHLRSEDGAVIENPQPEARNGVHSGSGFCFYRLGAAASLVRHSVDSRDFAPTILARLGVPVPAALQGQTFLE